MARPRTKRNYTGREKIIFTSVSHRDAPLSVELAGVTYPSPYYRIRHNPASSYVFEYVLEGRGWIEYEREGGFLSHPAINSLYIWIRLSHTV